LPPSEASCDDTRSLALSWAILNFFIDSFSTRVSVLLCACRTKQELYKVDEVRFVDELASTVKDGKPEKVVRALQRMGCASGCHHKSLK